MKRERILFVTRKYPPSIGGMQKVSYHLYTNLNHFTQSQLVSWGRSQKWLPIAYPYLFFSSLLKTKYFNPRVIHLGDAMMSPIGYLLKIIFGKKVTCTVHGLDLTFSFPGYQKLILFCLSKIDKVICVSSETQKEAIRRGLKKENTVVIPNGIDVGDNMIRIPLEKIKKGLKSLIGINLKDKKILLTVGRLVKRKGHQWFIKNVMTKLDKNTIYLIAGSGSEEINIQREIFKNNLSKRVFLLNEVTENLKNKLYLLSDIFIMPNIKVKGDIEGFGIVALEAASCGLPVIASNIEGIKDAVKHGENGYLVKQHNTNEFSRTIIELLNNDRRRNLFGRKARKFTYETFNWERIGNSYLKEFSRLL